MKMTKSNRIPAIPPGDYKGSQAAWMVALQERGFWDGNGWYGDVMIPEIDWWEILEYCEEGYGPGFIEFIDTVKCNRMNRTYSFVLRGLYMVMMVGILILIMGTIIWVAYPHIVSIFPKLVQGGFVVPHISWWDAICVMALVEFIASIGVVRNLLSPYGDDEDDEID
jgi:hypothetical protein